MTMSGRVGFGRAVVVASAALLAWAIVGSDDSFRSTVGTSALASSSNAAAPADSVSYAIGYDTARNAVEILKADRVDFDAESLILGFADAVRGNQAALADVDMHAALTRLEREVATRVAQERLGVDPVFRALAEHNARQSTEMLTRLSQREGAQQIDGGIWYVVLQEGSGGTPKEHDVVRITFTVRTAEGVVAAEGVGKEFRLSGMIEGGKRTLMRMKPGARWLVGVPADLAFGIGGIPPEIGPNQAVLIDCTLEGVVR